MTMNLIQQQTAAKDLPLQYLQQAVNGQNPNLTPWIATAELQRRTTMDQHMQKGQGPMPTVKDQVEQKAGLMATQAAQQAQGAQMQQAATPPGPVPAGVPQPEAQPEEPVRAAHGGLMAARTNLRFAHGGIMAFAKGGADDQSAAETKRLASHKAPPPPADDQSWDTGTSTLDVGPIGAPAAPAPDLGAFDSGRDVPDRRGLRSPAALQAARPTTVVPTDAARTSALGDALTKYVNMAAPDTSAEGAIAQQDKYSEHYGTNKPIGEEQRKYWAQQDALQEQRQKQAKDLAWSSYVQGLVGTPGSGALAHDTTMANALNQAGAYQSERYKNLSDLETAERAARLAQQTGAQGIQNAAQTRAAEQAKGQGMVAAQGFDSLMRDAQSKYNTDVVAQTQREINERQMAMSNNQFTVSQQNANRAALQALVQSTKNDVANYMGIYQTAAKQGDTDTINQIAPYLNSAIATSEQATKALGKFTGVDMPTSAPAVVSKDQQALQWANANPNDPRAAQIKQRLGQ